MDNNEFLTQELFDSLPLINGDIELYNKLFKVIKNNDLKRIVLECNNIYRRLIDKFLDKNDKNHSSMIYYSPLYKIYQDENSTNLFIFVATRIGKSATLQVSNVTTNINKVSNFV